MLSDVKRWNRHKRIFHVIGALLDVPVRAIFNYSYDTEGAENIDGPVLVIPNHSCAWDPILVGTAFRKKQMYFVASEHVLRMRFAGPLINWLLEPIPRKKATLAAGTVRSCLRHLKEGHSVAIFAEGEQTWDGISGKVFPATGKLIKQSNATLVTFRLEGAYLALPRWAKGIRRGKVTGHVVGIYNPEKLRAMTADEIREAVDRDIYYDIWKWQDSQSGGRIEFKGRGRSSERAAGLEKALFICPACRSIGTLKTSGSTISCSCGFRSRFTETGFLEDYEKIMKTIQEWDAWQNQEFRTILDRIAAGGSETTLFRDKAAELSLVEEGHKETLMTSGPLTARYSRDGFTMSVGDEKFRLEDVRLMAMVLSSTLFLKTDDCYYQVRTKDTNLRKYLKLWQYAQSIL